ncbi:MAG TPA: alpha/beta hydrolase [Opitutaceae bacterium]|nr:alpha/beta hydrolase [Opitutaceae bacterium]
MNPRLFLCLALFAGLTARAAVQTDIQYGTAAGESLKLDACVPDGPGPWPTVILVHGGGWTGGDKSGGPQKGYMAPMHDALTKAGFAWFTINYRLAPKYRYPAPLEDVETAIRWVKGHAAQYHLDPARIALAGESAGSELIGMAVVRADESTRVAAVVPFYFPSDLLADPIQTGKLNPSRSALIGRTEFNDESRAMLRAASPMYFIKPGLPPFLLVHGTADQSVPYQQSVEMQAKLRAAGVTCDLITIEGGAHGMLYWDKVAPGYQEKVVAWLKTTLKIADAPGKK